MTTRFLSYLKPLTVLKTPSLVLNRTMSTAATRHKFVLYAPDMTDPEAHERRLQVRPKHLEDARSNHLNGVLRLGGAMVTPESLEPGAARKMTGSVIIFEAENIEEAKKIVHSDAYYTGRVWDQEKIVISPFVVAVPETL